MPNRADVLVMVGLAVVLVAAVPTLSSASPPATGSGASSATGTIYACVKSSTGRMRFLSTGACSRGEKLVAWSVVGPPGTRGLRGRPGPTGPQGPVGPTGEVGPRGPAGGTSVLSGWGSPSGDIGHDGDFYVDMSDWRMWGPRHDDTWPLGTALVGPAGATGSPGPRGSTGATGAQGPPGPAGPAGPSGFGAFGAFGDFATQSIGVPPVPPSSNATPVLVRQSLVNSGFVWSDDSASVKLAPGTPSGWFNIDFSIQIQNSAINENEAYFWLRWNGIDQAWSNTGVYLGGKQVKVVAAWNFLVPMDADDTVSIMWATDEGAASLLAEDGANVPGPSIPSVIYTITQVSDSAYAPLP